MRRGCVGLALAWMCSLCGWAEVLRGPYVLLEDTQLIRIRFEVDRPDDEVTLLHGAETRSRVTPAYTRGTRDTFIADVAVDLSTYRTFRGYEIGRPGEKGRSYTWRSRINGELKEYPRLLVFGDSQGGAETLAKLGRQWSREDFDLIVGLGDLADAGSRYESWGEEFFGPLRDLAESWVRSDDTTHILVGQGCQGPAHEWRVGDAIPTPQSGRAVGIDCGLLP